MYLEVPTYSFVENNYYERLLGKASAQMIPGLLVGPQKLVFFKNNHNLVKFGFGKKSKQKNDFDWWEEVKNKIKMSFDK